MTVEGNKKLVEKYPFLKMDEEYKYTYLDEIPYGWRKAFGTQLCEELYIVLKEAGLLGEFRFRQIKEKFGALRVYSNTYTSEVFNIFDKYEKLSEDICIECGKPATRITLGWISPYCDDCVPKRPDGTEVDNATIEEYNKMVGN